MSNATYVSADQNWQDGTTIYWFEMDGETYGIAEGENAGPLDCDGMPIDYNEQLARRVVESCVVTDEIRKDASGL